MTSAWLRPVPQSSNRFQGRAILQAAAMRQNLAMTRSVFCSLDESTYHPRLAATTGLALVMFSNAACGTCRVVERSLPASLPPNTQLFRVDVQVAAALARAFDVFHLPTLLLYLDGRYHARLNCEVTPAALRAAIDHALQNPAEEEP
jgi:thioredoxin 1